MPRTSPNLAWTLALTLACAGDPADETATGSTTASESTTTSATSTGSGSTGSGSTSNGSTTTSDACVAPLARCDDACVDLDHDPAHCGACGSACEPGLACQMGACAVACGVDGAMCAGECVDLAHDPAHCGACDHVCDAGVPCQDGACAPSCAADEALCGEACVDPMADEAHCGGCDAACPGGQPCVYGLCVDLAIHHLLIGGQSLSNGAGSAVVSAEQPYQNLSFNTGVRAGAANLTAFVPLVETWDGSHGETIASGLANAVAAAEDGHVILASAHGQDGTPYSGVKKGTPPYQAGLAQVMAAVALAQAEGKSHAVRALAIIHGESDHIAGNFNYDQSLLSWQSDIEADVQAITGQLSPVPLFVCQMSSFTKLGGAPVGWIPALQLAAARARPDRIYVVGPKYVFPYVDGVHLSGEGERWLGEYYSKVYRRVLIDGERWQPLSPRSIARDGAVITIELEVPAPPLVIDTEAVTDPGALGFEYWDSSGAPPTIVDVALIGEAAVQITLSAPPTAGDRRLRYAYTGAPGAPAGPMTGARGNLRDSDPTTGASGLPLYNWLVHFDEPVP